MTKEELEREARINLKRRFGEFFPQLTISYVMGAEPREKQLEKEKCELLGIIQGKDKAIKDLEWQLKEVLEDNDNYQKENAELKEINEGYNRNRDKLIAMGFPTFKSCKEYSDKLTNLQKENTELKTRLQKTKKLLKKWLQLHNSNTKKTIIKKSENFLKE